MDEAEGWVGLASGVARLSNLKIELLTASPFGGRRCPARGARLLGRRMSFVAVRCVNSPRESGDARRTPKTLRVQVEDVFGVRAG